MDIIFGSIAISGMIVIAYSWIHEAYKVAFDNED